MAEVNPRYFNVPPPTSIDRARADYILDAPHQRYFSRAISNILKTDIAEITFAQIIDGLPLYDVVNETRHGVYSSYIGDAVLGHHVLCPGALGKTRSFRDEFNLLSIELPVRVRLPYFIVPTESKITLAISFDLLTCCPSRF